MQTIAVAGGAGNIGRTIVEALVEHQGYNVLVLARKSLDNQADYPPVLLVNYDNVEETAEVLKQHKVHTIISAIAVSTPDAVASEIKLVKAASLSAETKRFVASNWGISFPETNLPQKGFRLAVAEELRKTHLEWTRFNFGFCMDYYGTPHVKSHLAPLTFALDVAGKAAGIPGTGEEPMSFTYSLDVAKFVVASLGLDRWDEESYCLGERTTWNEVLRMAEEARGSKFTVSYDSTTKLATGTITELPAHVAAYAFIPKPFLQGLLSQFGLLVTAGAFDLPAGKLLNARFPEIEPLKLKEIIGAWKGKE